jgi:GMP synthase (glutamine-hydrolysing)
MTGPRVLVIDGNVADVRARQIELVGDDSGSGYVKMLARLVPELVCDIIRPADAPPVLPAGVGYGSYDGVAVTGSALNVYNGGAAVDRQIEVAKAVLDAGVPFFGSCWGLQIAVTAAGGVVRKNPRGREFGFARRILLTDAGSAHPLFAGKPRVFEAPTIHRDAIESLPDGAVTLAGNEMGLQAAAFTHGRGTFWGVQYHPEYEFVDIAAAAERYGRVLIEEGMFSDQPALHEFVADLRRLQVEPANAALAWKHGLGPAMTDERVRLLELRNWLEQQVLARSRRRT